MPKRKSPLLSKIVGQKSLNFWESFSKQFFSASFWKLTWSEIWAICLVESSARGDGEWVGDGLPRFLPIQLVESCARGDGECGRWTAKILEHGWLFELKIGTGG